MEGEVVAFSFIFIASTAKGMFRELESLAGCRGDEPREKRAVIAPLK